MSRVEKIITIFVGSPSDVAEERNKLEDVVRELNLSWSKTLAIRLDLIRWETHAYPGMGQDAQDVINKQIDEDYDIFIGIMWSRFGGPTGRAESGTEEEFLKAKKRYDIDPASIRIMFYFKDAPIALSKIDPSQLSKVNGFKTSLGPMGTLFWNFSMADDFESLVRIHLTRQIQEFIKNSQFKDNYTQVSNVVKQSDPEELGLLDFIEIYEERSKAGIEILGRINTATVELGVKMKLRAEEINKGAKEKISSSQAKIMINKAADDMQQYVNRVEIEIPIFRRTLHEGMHAFGKTASFFMDFKERNLEKIKENQKAITDMKEVLKTVQKSIFDFQLVVKKLPSMTAELNSAKKKTVEILDQLLQGLMEGERDAIEVQKLIDAMLS